MSERADVAAFDAKVRTLFVQAIERGEDHTAATARIKEETRAEWMALLLPSIPHGNFCPVKFDCATRETE